MYLGAFKEIIMNKLTATKRALVFINPDSRGDCIKSPIAFNK